MAAVLVERMTALTLDATPESTEVSVAFKVPGLATFTLVLEEGSPHRSWLISYEKRHLLKAPTNTTRIHRN